MTIQNIYIKDGEFVIFPHNIYFPQSDYQFQWRNYQLVMHPSSITLVDNVLTILYQATQCSSEIKDENSDNVCLLGTYTYTNDRISTETEVASVDDENVSLHELLYTTATLDVFVGYMHGQKEAYLIKEYVNNGFFLRTGIHACHLHDAEVATKDQVLKTFINGKFYFV